MISQRKSSQANGHGIRGESNVGISIQHGSDVYEEIRKTDKEQENKLGTFEGSFLPTALNVLSILMFLRFGFIIGQMGITGTFFLLLMSYSIDVLTVLSVSAISTNGTVKGGGAYYMISRSLGPEFGGAIGIIFYIGQILNASLNVVGFIEPLLVNFGVDDGEVYPILPDGFLWNLLYSTILLALCTCVALVGSKLVSKTAFLLFIILTLSTISIPISTLFVKPFYPLPYPFDYIRYSGPNWDTFRENFWPKFSSGAVGSDQPAGVPETFRNLFGIFFPATAGIFAGASMSGELKNPSKSIPRGTIDGLLVTFILYSLVILSVGSSIPRDLLHHDIKVIQTVNIHKIVIILGEFSTSLFSVIMGVVGAATMLNAIADDKILPGLAIFSTLKKKRKEQEWSATYSVLFTWLLAQIFLFANINQIATFITMAFLMTFMVTNLACFLLKIGSAPNFRPLFKYFSSKTAFLGALLSVLAMFIVDGISASVVIIFLVCLIMLIHYMTPVSRFGDISQLLIYHQVRKYLLRLKLQMSVKYWRPQILLLCDDPRTSLKLIRFCNHLKKGGLYILGHVVVFDKENEPNKPEFGIQSFKEQKAQREAWQKLSQVYKIKAFIQIAIGPTLAWGVRNVYLGSGLGGMRPNITVIGFYDFLKHHTKLFNRKEEPLVELPTDKLRKEKKIPLTEWVQIIEDLIIMQSTVAVAANFSSLNVPILNSSHSWFSVPKAESASEKKYIDLYPIQMSSISQLEDGKSVLSTNFDTYTLILQLGSILSTVPEWKLNGYCLRVVVFVEHENEIEEEEARLKNLLTYLRIVTEIKVVCIGNGSLDSYNYLVRGFSKCQTNQVEYDRINSILEKDQWWKNLCKARSVFRDIEKRRLKRTGLTVSDTSQSTLFDSQTALKDIDPLISSSLRPFNESPTQDPGFKLNRKYTLSNLHEQGMSVSLNMNTQFGSYFNNEDALSEGDSVSESEIEDMSELTSTRTPEAMSSVTSIPSAKNETFSRNYDKPNEYLKRKLDGFNKPKGDADSASIRSGRSNLRPNFSSMKTPQSAINENSAEGDEVANPSIRFVETTTFESTSKEAIIEGKGRGRPQDESGARRIVSSVLPSAMGSKGTDLRRPELRHTPSIISNDDALIQQMGNTKFMGVEETPDLLQSKQQKHNKMDDNISPKGSGIFNTTTIQDDGPLMDYTTLKNELQNLSFNDIPAKGQHLILNELMKKCSPVDKTHIIMSTLPAPMINTHLDANEANEYVFNLALWFDGLSPILLINSQTVTVTTTL